MQHVHTAVPSQRLVFGDHFLFSAVVVLGTCAPSPRRCFVVEAAEQCFFTVEL